jgi:dienelactone hydrolase
MRAVVTAAVVAVALVGWAAARSEEEGGAPGKITTKVVEYRDGEVTCKGWLAFDEAAKGPRPGVLVVHDWWGQGELARQTAERLAGWGYVGFAADMYGEAKLVNTPQEAGALAGKFRGEGRAAGRTRARAALDTLAAQAGVDRERLATLGFCFGGTVSLELAWSGAPLRAAVSFHGHPTTPLETDSWSGDLLVLHGADDPFVPPKMIEEFQAAMRAKKGEYEIVHYGGAVHSFTDPGVDKHGLDGARYDRRAAARSFERCRAFLAEAFAR